MPRISLHAASVLLTLCNVQCLGRFLRQVSGLLECFLFLFQFFWFVPFRYAPSRPDLGGRFLRCYLTASDAMGAEEAGAPGNAACRSRWAIAHQIRIGALGWPTRSSPVPHLIFLPAPPTFRPL
ncbi:hypothetical protein BD289DRAFT_174890 [Coniella lustricola]|uniref:Uncharacterized protein n=1 Tax=Coniella lustricola TaxID=2025994 RepID=A0A2T3ADZ1_9PEZI|nr:hypothetical protein BD289DRAFT_174890 [Coniella lustricola]